jgi:hypothetical protein
MTTLYIDDQEASRLYDANEANPSAENGDFTDWQTGDEFVLVVQVGLRIGPAEACNKAAAATTLKLQFSEDGGSFGDVATGQAIAPGSSTTLVHNDPTVQRISTAVPAGCTGAFSAGLEVEGVSPLQTGSGITIASGDWTEVHFACDPALASASSVYTFRVYDVTNSRVLTFSTGTELQSSVTIAAAAPDRNINIDDEESTITVTDVPTVTLPDALEINIAETIITVTDVVADMAQELVPDVFDSTGVTDVPSIEIDLNIAVAESAITVTDVVTDMAQELVPSVFDGVTVTDVVVDLAQELVPSVFDGTTVTDYVELAQELVVSVQDTTTVTDDETVNVLAGDLDINVFETAIGVTDVPTVDVEAGPPLEIDVFDSVTVTEGVQQEATFFRYTDWSEYTLDEQPADWTETWSTATYEASADILDGFTITNLHCAGPVGTRQFLRWDDVGLAAIDSDILMKVRPLEEGGEYGAGPMARGQVGTVTGYACFIKPDTNTFQITRYLNASTTSVANVNIQGTRGWSIAKDTWYWIRYRLVGDNHKAKIWRDSEAEPAGWDIDTTNSDVMIPGYIGIYTRAMDYHCQLFSAVTGMLDEEAMKPLLPGVSDETTVTDVETVQIVEELNVSEFDTTTVTDAVTVVLPDALKVSVFDGATISDFIGPCTVTCPTWDDDFTGSNGDPPDKQKWYQHQVLNPSDIQNNKLNMTVTGSGDDRYSGVRSTFRLTGNFSVTMDFDLVTYPSTQRWEVVIQLWNPSNDYRYSMGRHYRTGYNNHAYAAFKYEGSWVWDTDPTTDTSGKVRIIRQGTNMYCAYWQPDTGWTALASWSGVDTGDLEVRLWLATHDPSYPAAEANIDNFIIGRGCAGVERWILLPDVYDEVTVVDAETVVVKGATLQISEFETTTVTEDVTVSLPDALEISVFDVTTVTDVETVEVEEAGLVIISVFDTVTVTESVELAQELVLSVFDTVVVTESVDLAQELVPSVFDTVTVADVVDNVLVTEGLLEVSVFDTITVTESVDLAKELTVLVFETTGVTEYVELAKELTISVFSGTTVTDVETVTVVSLEISPNVFDGVTVGEAVTVSLPDALLVDVFDGVTAVDVETVEVGIVEFYNVSVYDETTVTDSVAAALPDALAITVSDTITVGEFTDFQFLNYFVSVFDTVTVTELVEVAPQLKIDVFDTTAVTDSISVALDDLEANVFDTVSVVDVVGFFIPNFGINVFETVTVTESTAGIIGTVILSTFDVVTVTDYSDLYWIVSKGVARIEVAERAPDIEFAARVPRIDYLVRS